MIVVIEGPSAAGKTTWCRRHASRWLPEPGRGPIDQVLRYQIDRWRQAVGADAAGELVVLDGDPFKLYYSWAEWRTGAMNSSQWEATVEATRRQFINGDYGLAGLVLYSGPARSSYGGARKRTTRGRGEASSDTLPCDRTSRSGTKPSAASIHCEWSGSTPAMA